MIGDEPHLKPLIDLPRMAEKTEEMLRLSLKAFIDHDADAARQLAIEDDEVDNLYDQVFRELLTFMAEDPRTITRATRLIWVAHNLERSADRVTNICERVVYTVTGRMEEIGASKY
jgi:phosphate transport system protein